MKNFKRLMALVLALVLSTSLFACGNGNELKLNDLDGEVKQIVDGNMPSNTLAGRITPRLSYSQDVKYNSWKGEVKDKLVELLGMDNIAKNACPLDVKIDSTEQVSAGKDYLGDKIPAYTKIHFTFNSEYGASVPCYLLIPEGGENYPLAITLQGHASLGYKYSVGDYSSKITPTIDLSTANGDPEKLAEIIAQNEEIEKKNQEVIDFANKASYAIQAIQNGYVALAIEQRGMASRISKLDKKACNSTGADQICDWSSYNALLLGRTIIGERVWEVSKAIDALSENALKDYAGKINLNDITVTGNSGGGTAAFYAGCIDERITVVAPSCSFCSYEKSLLYNEGDHCSCNFIPDAYTWFDMQDLTCLIAPRKLVVVYGATDPGFPKSGVEKQFDSTVKSIYEEAGAADNCVRKEVSDGHKWHGEVVWPAINKIRGVEK